MDSGGTANGGVDTLTQTFTVTVTQVNQPPTIDPIVVTNPQILENAGQQTINLTGIIAGPGDTGADRDDHRHQQQPECDPEPDDHLQQPQHHRHAHLHAGALHLSARRRSPSP